MAHYELACCSSGLLYQPYMSPIIECSALCACEKGSCTNRVVQCGQSPPHLRVVRTVEVKSHATPLAPVSHTALRQRYERKAKSSVPLMVAATSAAVSLNCSSSDGLGGIHGEGALGGAVRGRVHWGDTLRCGGLHIVIADCSCTIIMLPLLSLGRSVRRSRSLLVARSPTRSLDFRWLTRL